MVLRLDNEVHNHAAVTLYYDLATSFQEWEEEGMVQKADGVWCDLCDPMNTVCL